MQLMLALEAVMQRFRPHLNAHGLTDQQWRIVRALYEVEALEIARKLGRACCLHTASLSRTLPNLQIRTAWISRRASERDQRRVGVSLTGRAAGCSGRSRRSQAIYARLAQEVGPDRLEQIFRLLDEITGILAKPKSACARLRRVLWSR